MSKPNPNTEYEKFVANIVQALLKAQSVTTKVLHDVQLPGVGRSHQIDVYWAYRVAGVDHRIIINCKNYKRRVKAGDVDALLGVLTDVRGTQGVIVTTVGFERGAIDVARAHNIGLKIVRPPVDSDYEGRIREIRLHLSFYTARLLDTRINMDKEWLEANVDDPAAVAGFRECHADDTFIADDDIGLRTSIADLWMKAQSMGEAVDSKFVHTFSWSNGYLESVGGARLKIKSLVFTWEHTEPSPHEEVVVRGRNPEAIVRDALSGTLLFVDDEGTITGDVAEEFGDTER